MSELRARLANELGSALADWVDNKTNVDSNRPAIIAAINDFAYDEADAVLRVLAEHGDTQQIEREIADAMCLRSDDGDFVDRVVVIVRRIAAARDTAEAELQSRRTVIRMQDKAALELKADLAATRQQLEQVRALAADRCGFITSGDLLAILDAPARPAGHDESGQ